MMLRPATIEKSGKAASVNYLMATEYYIGAGGEPKSPSKWNGRLAARMNIEGRTVTQKHLENVLEGFSPSGREKLSHNAGKDSRKKLGYDCPLTVPKSVSVLYSQSSPEMQEKIMQALHEANREAIRYLEENVAVRTGKSSSYSGKCEGLAVASIIHPENRGGEPHIHIHNAIAAMAATKDENGKSRVASLDESELFRHFRTAGAVADCAMARALANLGVVIGKPEGYGFRIADVPVEVEKALSKRGEEITDHQVKTGKSRDQAQKDTKGTKQERTVAELDGEWAKKAKETGWGHNEAAACFGRTVRTEAEVEAALKASVGETLDELARSKGIFTRDELARAVAIRAAADGGLTRTRLDAVTLDIMQDARLVALGQQQRTQGGARGTKQNFSAGADEVFTTARVLRTECDILKSFADGKGDRRHIIPPDKAASAVAEFERMKSRELGKPVSLKKEQRDLLEYLATCGRQALIEGDPGTGKTFSMEAAKGMLQAAGYTRFEGTAIAATAAEGLGQEAKLDSSGSIASLLIRMEKGLVKDDAKTAVIVDEAAMADPFAVRAIQRYFKEAKIVFLGDPKQLQSIEGGGWMRGLIAAHGGARLQEITRQKNDWHVEAIKNIGEGRGDLALNTFEEKGLLTFHEDESKSLSACVSAYLADTAGGKDKSMIAASNYETAQLNRIAHDALSKAGKIGPSHAVIVAKKEDFAERLIGAGERLVITKNDRILDIKNGDCCTVETIEPNGRGDGFRIAMTMDKDGRRVEIDTAAFAHVEQSYARTNHKLQGKTLAEHAYVHIGNASQTLREFWYVAASRSKDWTKFFGAGDIRDELSRSIVKSGAKGWTLDHMRPAEAERVIAVAERKFGTKVEAIAARIVDRDYAEPAPLTRKHEAAAKRSEASAGIQF